MICSGPRNMGKIPCDYGIEPFQAFIVPLRRIVFTLGRVSIFLLILCSDRNIVFPRILYSFKHVFRKKQIFSSALGKHNKYQLTSQKPFTTWDLSICLMKLGCSAGKFDCISSALAIADSLFSSTLQQFNKCTRVANFRYSLLTTI